MRAWADVAVLAKTRNLNGGFVAKSAAGLPFLLEPGTEVALVPPVLDAPRRARVEAIERRDERTAFVLLSGIDDIAVAKALVGCHLLARRDDIDWSALDQLPASWEGWTVRDVVHGDLGAVSSIIENPGQALIAVARPDGSGETLIPVVDEFIRTVDVDERLIEVGVPEGLLDL